MKKALGLLLVLAMIAAVPAAQAAARLDVVFARVFPNGNGVLIIDHYTSSGVLMFRAITQYIDNDGSGDLSAGDTIRARWAKKMN